MKSEIDRNSGLTPYQKLVGKRGITILFVPPCYRGAENDKDMQDYIRAILFGC